MRYAVISDIHSNLEALEAVIREIPTETPVLCLGDIVGYGSQPNEVIEAIQHLNLIAVLMGNHDYAVVTGDVQGFSSDAASAIRWTRNHITARNMQFLSTLNPEAHLELEGTPIALYHGSPRDPLFEYIYPMIIDEEVESLINVSKCRIILLGHTHVPMCLSVNAGILANPGSVGQPRDGDPNASIGFLSVASDEFNFQNKRVKYDVQSAATKIIQSGLPLFLASRLREGT